MGSTATLIGSPPLPPSSAAAGRSPPCWVAAVIAVQGATVYRSGLRRLLLAAECPGQITNRAYIRTPQFQCFFHGFTHSRRPMPLVPAAGRRSSHASPPACLAVAATHPRTGRNWPATALAPGIAPAPSSRPALPAFWLTHPGNAPTRAPSDAAHNTVRGAPRTRA